MSLKEALEKHVLHEPIAHAAYTLLEQGVKEEDALKTVIDTLFEERKRLLKAHADYVAFHAGPIRVPVDAL